MKAVPTDESQVLPIYIRESSLRSVLRLFARGVTLRCPHCGEGRLRDGWLKLKLKCPVCSLRTDRGEEDFFLGGMMWNIVFAEGLLLFSGLLIGLLTWPDVPWRMMQWLGPVLMAAAPFIFYPFSLGFWLANDIALRPVTDEEMEWHRASAPGEFRSRNDR
jgi:uncharacterized protein (DUF983 family)